MHGVPRQRGRIGGGDSCKSLLRFLEKRRERLELRLRKSQKRAVHDIGMRRVQQRHNAERDNQECEPQEDTLVFPVVAGLIHGRFSLSCFFWLCNGNMESPFCRSFFRFACTRRI